MMPWATSSAKMMYWTLSYSGEPRVPTVTLSGVSQWENVSQLGGGSKPCISHCCVLQPSFHCASTHHLLLPPRLRWALRNTLQNLLILLEVQIIGHVCKGVTVGGHGSWSPWVHTQKAGSVGCHAQKASFLYNPGPRPGNSATQSRCFSR